MDRLGLFFLLFVMDEGEGSFLKRKSGMFGGPFAAFDGCGMER